MTQKSPIKSKSLHLCSHRLLLTGGVSLISSFSLLSAGFVWGQSHIEPELSGISAPPVNFVTPPVKKKANPVVTAPAPVRVAPVKPKVVPRAPVTSTTSPPSPVRVTTPARQRQSVVPEIRSQQTPVLSPPKVSVPKTIDRPPTANFQPAPVLTTIPTTPNVGKNSYVDNSSNYNLGSSASTPKPVSVVITERATGCRTVAQQGQLTQGSCNVSVSKPAPPKRVTPKRVTPTRTVAVTNRKKYTPVRSRTTQALTKRTYPVNQYQQVSQKSPVASASPSPSSTGSKGYSSYYAKTGRPVYASNNNTSLLFPLSVPSAISSAFGWRVHPISGDYRMHTGTDIAAPLGTPVLASYVGKVAYADYLGGYGLTVVLRHEQGSQESRYAHLAQIFVRPGESVQQGEIIGLVGSTGNSTGPHLHFEWRHLMPSGWVPVDAGVHLEYAMYNLVNALQAARLNPVSSK